MTTREHPQIGFETIGNAIIICFDGGEPILSTDPWITDEAYFGSWGHTHQIPEAQMTAVKNSKFVWFSHGHPDHLNGSSLPHFKGSKILLPDHVGGRIKNDLLGQGYDVDVLPDQKWVTLSENIRVLCLSDYNQDAILLIDVGGRLLVNLNDSGNRGWEGFVKATVKNFPKSFLLALSGYGDADMIHFLDENGKLIPPVAAKRFPVGASIAKKTESFGCGYFIPSSSMHRYQRSDSIWANNYATKSHDYANGFESTKCELLPSFISYDCKADQYHLINPPSNEEVILTPESFGDNWSDVLETGEIKKIETYLRSIEHLSEFLDFINFRVGGKDNVFNLSKRKFNRGITFEVPKGSLMTAVDYEVFDDLLIGNFMKTSLHGKWPRSKLYPDFTPYVAKYSDNGRAKSLEELEVYFKEYQKRAPLNFLRHKLEEKSKDLFRTYVPGDSPVFQTAKKIYWDLKRHF